MTEKIPQHRHCSKCGKAFLGEERFCSEECKVSNNELLKKRKRQLLILYGLTVVVLIAALLFVGV